MIFICVSTKFEDIRYPIFSDSGFKVAVMSCRMHLLAIFKFCVVFFPVLFTIPIIPPYAPMCGNFSQIEILKLYKNDPIIDGLKTD